jgi:nuclease S1
LILRAVVVAGLLSLATATAHSWGPQGHRLIALVAANHLTPPARQNVKWLLDDASLADVAVWADDYLQGNNQTSFWHYVNIPLDARRYDRNRDCPRQPGVSAGGRNDRWRDCVVDRIRYNQERAADRSLDRADRAVALKFLVHFIGDLHQPFHALGVERGGNGIPVVVFGSPTCRYADGARFDCNMHALWDSELIARRKRSDRAYVTELERQIAARKWTASGSAEEWAMESHALAKAALLPARGDADEAYSRTHMPVIEQRLALGGLRLAAAINEALSSPRP